jgi:hypothetical protein
MVFNAAFKNISAISWRSVNYWWRKPAYPKKTTDLSQVTVKLHHIMLKYVIKRATERTENLNIQFSFKGNEKDIAWDRHKNVCVCGGVVLPVNGSQPSTLDNCISNGNTCTSKQ